MTKHLDFDKKELQSGIYKCITSNSLYYFTGKYDKSEDPLFEDSERKISSFPFDSSRLMKRLTHTDIIKLIDWLEKGLDY